MDRLTDWDYISGAKLQHLTVSLLTRIPVFRRKRLRRWLSRIMSRFHRWCVRLVMTCLIRRDPRRLKRL